MENLNKENFWDEMELKFPGAMNVFKQWIDGYKEEVKWDELFGEDLLEPVKFHDLPFDMQVGILIRFNYEIFKRADVYMEPHMVKEMFSLTLGQINNALIAKSMQFGSN